MVLENKLLIIYFDLIDLFGVILKNMVTMIKENPKTLPNLIRSHHLQNYTIYKILSNNGSF